MSVYIGGTKIGKLSLGGVGIREAYVGSTCVYRTEVVRTYEAPLITEFGYSTLGFREGATAEPTLKFTQDWSDNFGNSGTLTEETTPFTAEYTAYSSGGGAVYFQLGENGEVVADSKNTSGDTVYLGSVNVSLVANGMTAGASSDVNQASRTAGVVDPVVNIDTTLFQNESGSGTKKVYFNIDATMNSALSITPKYLLDSSGDKYDVVVEAVTHQNTSSSGTTTTNYWAELPYNGASASLTFHLWCEFTFDTGEGERGYVYTDTDDVQATNFLAIDTSGDFYVRS